MDIYGYDTAQRRFIGLRGFSRARLRLALKIWCGIWRASFTIAGGLIKARVKVLLLTWESR
jgi:hypothetical protein